MARHIQQHQTVVLVVRVLTQTTFQVMALTVRVIRAAFPKHLPIKVMAAAVAQGLKAKMQTKLEQTLAQVVRACSQISLAHSQAMQVVAVAEPIN
jgi:hypothetical protein